MRKTYHTRRHFIQQVSAAGLVLGMVRISSSAQIPEKVTEGKRIGIIGLDSSHSIEFTKLLNTSRPNPSYKDYRVTVAFPMGSEQIENGAHRITDHIREIENYHVRIVSSIEELLNQVDVVMLETNDGHMHVEQAMAVIKTGKPLFIDKPIAASLEDVKIIFQEAEKYQTPVFSSSALRYLTGIEGVAKGSIGMITGADVYCPAILEKSHPDLFWYGIHGVEMLFAVLGSECNTVTRVHTSDTDIIVGEWEHQRMGVMRGMRSGKTGFGGTVYGENGIQSLNGFEGYQKLVEKIIDFFDSRVSPVPAGETIKIYAFMEAADESKRQGGKSISLLNLS